MHQKTYLLPPHNACKPPPPRRSPRWETRKGEGLPGGGRTRNKELPHENPQTDHLGCTRTVFHVPECPGAACPARGRHHRHHRPRGAVPKCCLTLGRGRHAPV